MERTYRSFALADVAIFKQKMLNWTKQFNIFCLLDNHQYDLPYHSYDCLLAVGTTSIFNPSRDFFQSLSHYYKNSHDWIFGHFSYDIKNKIEDLSSNNIDGVEFPEVFLFVPKVVLQLEGNKISIGSFENVQQSIFDQINKEAISTQKLQEVCVAARISRQQYIAIIQALKEHILKGDCYEINFCQEFYADNCTLNPLTIYEKLTAISPNPFAAFYKVNSHYLICASPERYIKKEGRRVITQPIKGTITRNLHNDSADLENLELLKNSDKERSENVMIVDLVRNDLSKICKEATVSVTDLFGIHSFPQVHQMVSTIEGELEDDIDLPEVLKATFPMGSMTGAPKKKVMELIEQYEVTKRGIYSGAVGYISPQKDFDFNVVIRSVVYNELKKYLSYHVGSAITFNSNPEDEYNECLLKAAAIKKVLQ